jgi:hypothetical protein
MSKNNEGSLKPATHFEQVPLEIVKKIIDQDPPEPTTKEPPTPLRIVRKET